MSKNSYGKYSDYEGDKLKQENEKLKEFVQDCSVSHNETRYKYRAQVLLREIEKLIEQ